LGGKIENLFLGGGSTCAAFAGGDYKCWGSNHYGKLGYGHTNPIGDDETPAAVGNVRLNCEMVCGQGECEPDPCKGLECKYPPLNFCEGNRLLFSSGQLAPQMKSSAKPADFDLFFLKLYQFLHPSFLYMIL